MSPVDPLPIIPQEEPKREEKKEEVREVVKVEEKKKEEKREKENKKKRKPVGGDEIVRIFPTSSSWLAIDIFCSLGAPIETTQGRRWGIGTCLDGGRNEGEDAKERKG